MPRIRPFAPQVEARGPTDARRYPISDVGYGEAIEHIGKAINEASNVFEKRAEQSDVSDLHAKMSEAHANFTTNLGDTLRTADPGDKNLTDNFIKGYDDYMSGLSDHVNTSAGREYFTKMSAEMRAHFVEKATAGQAELAGVKAKQDYTTALNNYSSSLIQDPSSFDQVRQMHSDSLDDLVKNHSLPRDVELKLKENGDKELAKSAARGWISNNPGYADKLLKAGKFDAYIDGDLKHQLLGEVTQAQRAAEAEQARQDKKAKDALAAEQMTTQDQFLKKLTNGELTNKDILNSNLDPFGSGSKEQFIKLTEAQSTQKLKTDPSTFKNLFERIHLPDGDPNKLMDENELNQYVVKGQLSFEDLNKLRQETQGKRTEEGSNESLMYNNLINAAKSRLLKPDKLTGLVDPIGAQQYQGWLNNFLTMRDAARKAGVSARDLTTPGTKDSLWPTLDQFARKPEDIIRSMVNQPQNPTKAPAQSIVTPPTSNAVAPPISSQRTSPPPVEGAPPAATAPAPSSDVMMRKPGESITEWRERTKGL